MATTPPPSAGASQDSQPKPSPKPSSSEAIQTGADLFVAFFEIEIAKATAAFKHTIRDLEARFSEFQKSSHSSAVIFTRRCADLEAAIRSTRIAHDRAVTERSLAHTRMLDAQQQLAKVKHELDHLKSCSKTEHSSCLQLTPERAGNGATDAPKEMQNCDAEIQADDLNIIFSLKELRRQLIDTQQLLEGKERDCKAVEKERDDLKATIGTEAMMLKNRIFSLQAELESLKDSQLLTQTGSRGKDMLVGGATHSVAHDTTSPTSSTPREDGFQEDVTQSSKTLSALPLSCTTNNSEQANFVSVAHTTNGPSAAGRAPSVTSGAVSAHTASHSSISPTSPSLNPTSGSFIQKDDENLSFKRPASDSINSSLETSAKRVKRDHLPNDQSPVPNSPSHQPSGYTIDGSGIGPTVLRHSSNQLDSEARMKHTSASEGNAGHRSSRGSDNQNQVPPSRPKPKPAYSGLPSNSTVDASDSKSNEAVSEHTHSRPKPRPAFSGANTIHSGSISSRASGSAD